MLWSVDLCNVLMLTFGFGFGFGASRPGQFWFRPKLKKVVSVGLRQRVQLSECTRLLNYFLFCAIRFIVFAPFILFALFVFLLACIL